MKLDRATQATHWLNLADLALATDHTAVADRCLNRAAALADDLPRTQLIDARLRLRMNEAGRALAALNRFDAERADPDDRREAAFVRCRALIAADRADEAATLLRELTGQYPDDERPHRMLAGLCLDGDDAEQAVGWLRRLARVAPHDLDDPRPATRRIAADPEAAAERLLSDDEPIDQTGVWLLMARLFVALDHQRDAQEMYDRLLREHRDDAALWLEAGELADLLGADEPAVRKLTAAVAQADDDVTPRALAALAKAHMHAGRPAAAGRCWWRLTRRAADDAEAWAGLLVCALAAGKSRLAGRIGATLDAITTSEQRRQLVAEMWPHAAGAVELRRTRREPSQDEAPAAPKRSASVLRDMLDNAVVVLNAHADEHPRRADAHYHLAVCQAATDDAPAAALSARAALRINPRYKAAAGLREQLKAA